MRRSILLLVAAPIVLLAACGGSDDSSTPSDSTTPEAVATNVQDAATDTTAPVVTDTPTATDVPVEDDTIGSDAPVDSTEAPADTTAPSTVAPTTAPPTTAAPDSIQQLPGVEPITVTAAGADPSRPTFSWNAPATATDFDLVVQDASGRPLWAWTGAETTVVLGGVERPADVEGPTLTGPAQVRVFAYDAARTLVGSSAWTPLTG